MSKFVAQLEPARWRRAAYGFGDLGFNLYWTTVSFYILYFYTDVLGLSGTAAGFIFLFAMIWDAITDPIIGFLAQRTRTRWGSYRPYILFGTVPLALSLVLLFYDPGLKGAAQIAFALLAHMLFRTAYTIVNIPYSALSAKITRSSEVRNELAAWRISLATIGSAFVAYATLKLVGELGDGNQSIGFVRTAAIYAILSVPIFAILFATTHELDSRLESRPAGSLRECFKAIARNKPFLIVAAATVFGTIGGVLVSKLIVYYFKYTLGDATAVGALFAVNSAIILIAAPFWAIVTAKTSKRFVWRAGALLSIAGSLLLFANPYEEVVVVIVIAAIGAVGSAAAYLTFWSAIPDTVDFGEVRTGTRLESLTFGTISFIQKSSYGIAAALAGIILDGIGFTANEAQNSDTLEALKMFMTLLPAVFVLAAFVLIGKYRLDSRTHQRVSAILERRNRQQLKVAEDK